MAKSEPVKTRKAGAAFASPAARNDDGSLLEQVRRGSFSSNQLADPFKNWYSSSSPTALNILTPPYNPNALLKMLLESSVLKQCVEAMVTNVSGHGFRLEYVGTEGMQNDEAAVKEAASIEAFCDHINEGYSLTELFRRVRYDLEATGNAYIEVARDKNGLVTSAWHSPAHLMRITEADKDPVAVKLELPRFGKVALVTVNKYFRRFVQIKGDKKVYFKEYDDPRTIDPATGREEKGLPHEESATEIIHIPLYHAGNVYGVPRWVNNAVAVQGARQAELTNLDYFADNGIPGMVVSVSGGTVTQQSMERIEQHFSALRGRAAQNRIVFIEVYADEDVASERGNIQAPKVDFHSFADDRPQDGLFLEYDKAQTNKIRSSFRLPPIFLGLSEDYTRATANTSYDVAEGQVFGPDRAYQDDLVNLKLLKGYPMHFWKVRSNPPRITDPEDIFKAIEKLELVGAMTPNIAIGIATEMFDLDIERIKEDWGDFPFAVVKSLAARGQVKGWDAIVQQIDTSGAANMQPGAQATGQQPGQTTPQAQTAKIVRRALMDLRSVMLSNGEACEIASKIRSRSSATEAALETRAEAQSDEEVHETVAVG